ncbi:DNA polymerase, partial [bacterium]|nr:DNA polymerase [bacterium]
SFDEPMEVAKSLIRTAIRAPEGKRFSCADWSAIEARMLAYLAGEETLMDIFRSGGDPYVTMASIVYNVETSEVTKPMRQLGKQIILGCGYGMSARTFEKTCEGYGMDLSQLGVTAEKAVKTYRNSYKSIPKFWYALDDAVMKSVESPGAVQKVGRIHIKTTGGKMYIKLPSGRCIAYQGVQIRQHPYFEGKMEVSYMTQAQGRYIRVGTYGGKLCENVVQGACADLMMFTLDLCSEKGLPVVMTVHDEVVVEDSRDRLSELTEIMQTPPDWCSDFPLDAEGWVGESYRK